MDMEIPRPCFSLQSAITSCEIPVEQFTIGCGPDPSIEAGTDTELLGDPVAASHGSHALSMYFQYVK